MRFGRFGSWFVVVASFACVSFASAQALSAPSRQVIAGDVLSGVSVTVTITSPSSSSTYDAGTASSVTLAGSAIPDGQITGCTYVNDLGGSGSAAVSGSTWNAGSVALTVGTNVITVTCAHAGGTSGIDTISITRSSSSLTCTTTFSAGTTAAQVNAYINNASTPDGAVACFSSGNYTWGGGTAIQPLLSKGFTMVCLVELACDVAYSGGFPGTWRPGWVNIAGGTSNKCYRISGFDFTAPAAGSTWFAWDDTGPTTLSCVRMDHNRWTTDDDDVIFNIGSKSVFYIYGVIDHNILTETTFNTIFFFLNNAQDVNATQSTRLGTGNNLFLEDNEFSVVSDSGASAGCMDAATQSAGWVIRFNTATNCRFVTHGVFNNWGPANFEVYGNKIFFDAGGASCCRDGFRMIHSQGSGTIGFWGNEIDAFGPHNSGPLAIQHYGAFKNNRPTVGVNQCDGDDAVDGNRQPDATYQGYPCKHQPGRVWTIGTTEADFRNAFYPVFAFKNRWSDDNSHIALQAQGGPPDPGLTDYTGQHLVLNRDWYNDISLTENTCAGPGQTNCSPFTGATGIGHGPLSGRPDTCTVGPDSDVGEPDEGRSGVMYWATDQGSWNTSTSNPKGVQQNGADGVLYMCTATNTWSVYYTPYTYPHPLNVP